jgi:hypothetical protein
MRGAAEEKSSEKLVGPSLEEEEEEEAEEVEEALVSKDETWMTAWTE